MRASQKRSISARLSDSVGSIIRELLTGQDTVGAWKPKSTTQLPVLHKISQKMLVSIRDGVTCQHSQMLICKWQLDKCQKCVVLKYCHNVVGTTLNNTH